MLECRRPLPYRLDRQPACLLMLRIGNGQRPQQHPLHFRQRRRPALHALPSLQRRLPQFFPQHRRIDPQLLRRVHRELVPRQLLRHAPNVRQQIIHRLHLLLRAGAWEQLPRPLDQVIGLPPRAADRLLVCLRPALADIAVRIEPVVERDDLDGKSLFRQQRNRFFRRIRSRRIGIEVHRHLRGVPLAAAPPAAR